MVVCRYFLWRFFILCSTLNFLTDSYTWPLLVYMLLICIYPFTSSCAHTFSTMSPESRHICYFFDYGALSLYSLGEASHTFKGVSLCANVAFFCFPWMSVKRSRCGSSISSVEAGWMLSPQPLRLASSPSTSILVCFHFCPFVQDVP